MAQFGFPRQRSVDQGHFAIAPQPGVDRSVFSLNTAHKTTFDAGYLVPVYYTQVLPGDSFKVEMTALTRMSTLIAPLMDNLYLDSFFFFVPYRLLWSNWRKFMGERTPNTNSSIDFVIPQITNNGGAGICTLADYFAIPVDTAGGFPVTWNALWFRAYNKIFNEWFRDENIQDSVPDNMGNGPDLYSDYVLLRRGKRYDYFTSSLISAQKGNPVSLPLGISAPVLTAASPTISGVHNPLSYALSLTGGVPPNALLGVSSGGAVTSTNVVTPTDSVYPTNLYADLTAASAATINTLRTSVALQQFLERDSRGGTRYTEIIRSHFGVMSPDSRLQRPEYLGGGSSPISINPVAQTSATGEDSPLGNLGGVGTGIAQHGFSQSFTEHGVVIGLVSVRADLTYQQGLDRHWSYRTRHELFWPEYAHLGEQAVLRGEIYTLGAGQGDDTVFGYQERNAEYRFERNKITGMFRSGIPGTLDYWHLGQYFSAAPSLSPTFIVENPPVNRVVAAGDLANGQQFLFDSVFNVRAVRPIPMYGTPGLLRL